MIILLIALGLVFLIWIISMFVQKKEKKTREEIVKQHLEEKKKEEEAAESRSPFRD
ncbi:MAG: hypothetical protein WBB37_00255 [bacterium]